MFALCLGKSCSRIIEPAIPRITARICSIARRETVSHVHTGLSLDAGLFSKTLDHEDAYRFARGEELVSSTGLPVKLSRPLDWLVITDHSDMMGIAADIQAGTPNILAIPEGKLPTVGNTVDIEVANWTNTIGASELATVWTDPDFDPDQRAFYYGRV